MATDDDDVQQVLTLGHAAAQVFSHPKIQSLSAGAGWLWITALAYLTAGNGTLGGLVTVVAFRRNGWKIRHADELVRVGLWRVDKEGWRMRRLSSKAPAPPPVEPAPVQMKVGAEVLSYDAIGHPGSWVLTEGQVAEWQATFTTVNVLNECRYAKAWIEANTTRRKTVRGMPSFLVRWLQRATDQRQGEGGGRTKPGRTGPAPAGKYDHLTEREP